MTQITTLWQCGVSVVKRCTTVGPQCFNLNKRQHSFNIIWMLQHPLLIIFKCHHSVISISGQHCSNVVLLNYNIVSTLPQHFFCWVGHSSLWKDNMIKQANFRRNHAGKVKSSSVNEALHNEQSCITCVAIWGNFPSTAMIYYSIKCFIEGFLLSWFLPKLAVQASSRINSMLRYASILNTGARNVNFSSYDGAKYAEQNGTTIVTIS